MDLFIKYMNFVGYSKVILEKAFSEKINVIDEIYRSYIEKDVSLLHGVKRTDVFSKLIRILASQREKWQILKSFHQHWVYPFQQLKNIYIMLRRHLLSER